MSYSYFRISILTLLLLPIFEVFGQVEELNQATPGLQSGNDMMVNWVKMLGSLVVVLAIFFLGVLLFRKYGTFLQPRRGTGMLQILETKPLNQRNMLYVVECMGNRFLVASGQQGTPSMIPIHGALQASDLENTSETAPLSPDFAGAISKALVGKE